MTIIIWATPTYRNRNAEWLREVKNKLKGLKGQSKMTVSLQDVKFGIRSMVTWKANGPDRIHGFWYKKFSKRHGLLLNFRKHWKVVQCQNG